MHTSVYMHDVFDEYTGDVDCTILDAGPLQVDRCEFAAVIRSILDGQVAELARDRNAICYRVCLFGRKGTSSTAIVKVPPRSYVRFSTTYTRWTAWVLCIMTSRPRIS